MRLSHITQLALKALYSKKIGCGTECLFLRTLCYKTCSQGNTGLVFSRWSWYITHVEQVD
jgi:hypothetical protein